MSLGRKFLFFLVYFVCFDCFLRREGGGDVSLRRTLNSDGVEVGNSW